LAKKILKDNPPKNDKNKDKNKDKKDDKKDQKKDGDKNKKDGDKDKDKGDKDKSDKNGKNDDKSNQEGKPKPTPGGISPQRTQNLLDAVNNEEKKVQNKVNAQKVKGKPVQTEKDW
jgi:hypothetical protein